LLPQAFYWIRQSGARARRALLLLAVILLAVYTTNFDRLAFLSDLLDWSLFAVLVSLLVSGLKQDVFTLFRIPSDPSTRPARAAASEERGRVAVVIAAYNEEENIAPLTSRLVTTLDSMGAPWRLIYVIEGTDRTLEVAGDFARQRPEIQILYNPTPSGLGRAFRRGFDAVPADAGVVVTMDADLNHQPEEMPALISALNETGADIVVGSRRLEHSRTDGAPLWKTVTSAMMGIAMNVLFGVNVKDMTSGFRVYRAACLRALEYRNDNFAFLPEMLIEASALGAVIEERPIHFIFRVAGESKMALWRTFRSYVSLFGSLRRPGRSRALRRIKARAAD
jgi:dolichol-phosphate mannosyltransferase